MYIKGLQVFTRLIHVP